MEMGATLTDLAVGHYKGMILNGRLSIVGPRAPIRSMGLNMERRVRVYSDTEINNKTTAIAAGRYYQNPIFMPKPVKMARPVDTPTPPTPPRTPELNLGPWIKRTYRFSFRARRTRSDKEY